ncbi:MAG: M28 family peptidase [Bacteroidales bacterium]|nr:M28 family peptidase [Bacteroidales bacterium]MBP3820988.1 M28 family peptidase [bacterium]
MKRLWFLVIALVCSMLAYCQDYSYARKIIRQLADSSTYGRGYIKQGDQKAASIIEYRMYDNGFGKSPNFSVFNQKFTYQTFCISVNNIDSVYLALNNIKNKKREGYDYIVYGFSPTCDIKLKNENCLVFNNKNKLLGYNKQMLQNKVVILNKDIMEQQDIDLFLRELNEMSITPKLIIIQGYEKLKYRVKGKQYGFAVLCLKGNVFKTSNIPYLHLKISATYNSQYTTQNIWAVVPGTEYKDSCFMIITHYDHSGMCGNALFPGANDNGSGVALLLNLIKYYAQNPQKYSMVFLFCAGKELGSQGSEFAIEYPFVELDKVKLLLDLDVCGTGSEGISIVNGKNIPEKARIFNDINDYTQAFININMKENSVNSNHYPFMTKNIPAFSIYTEGKEDSESGTVNDKAEILPLTKYPDLFNLITDYFRILQVEFSDTMSLNGTTWQLKSFVDIENNTVDTLPKNTNNFILNFNNENKFTDNENKITGKTDCNDFWWEYKLEKGIISIKSGLMTEMYCSNSKEAKFIQWSLGDHRFFLKDKTLRLYIDKCHRYLEFEKIN